MKIGEFREAVDSLNWNRHDLSGATRQEFVAMDVRLRLERHIVIVTSLQPLVHARFAHDLERARSAIESAQATIVRWESYRAEGQVLACRVGALFGALPRGREPEPRKASPAQSSRLLSFNPALRLVKCAAILRWRR